MCCKHCAIESTQLLHVFIKKVANVLHFKDRISTFLLFFFPFALVRSLSSALHLMCVFFFFFFRLKIGWSCARTLLQHTMPCNIEENNRQTKANSTNINNNTNEREMGNRNKWEKKLCCFQLLILQSYGVFC